jgi:hypothetical protein
MFRRSVVVGGLWYALWLVACSSSSTGGSSTPPDTACEDLAGALCDKWQECVPRTIESSYVDVDDCKVRQKALCLKSVNAPSSAATGDFTSGCAAAYRATSCDQILDPPEACKTPAGALADGSPCGDGAQCSGRRCNKGPGANCGKCAAKAGAGGDCVASSDCEDDLRCAPDGTCETPAQEGEACGRSQPCATPFFCSKGKCGAAAQEGQNCSFGAVCDTVKGLLCTASDVCVLVKLVNPGETCGAVNNAKVACAANGRCDNMGGLTGKCQAALADGASCSAAGPNCQAPAVCTDGVCTIPDPATCK